MAKAASLPTSEASSNPALTWMDLALRAGGSAVDFWRRSVDDWSEVLARTTSMVLRPIDAASLGTTQIGSGFPQRPDGKTIDELAVGDSASLTRRLSQADIDTFARISGDDNPAHVDETWAAKSSLKGRVAHGMLTAGLVSAVLGTELPGPGAIYMSQTLRWLAPVRPGDVLTATATVKEIIAEKGRVVLDTVVSRGDDVVLVGEALVMPRRDQ
jgi:3-hydroxybutyryl-CoA dehydratase